MYVAYQRENVPWIQILTGFQYGLRICLFSSSITSVVSGINFEQIVLLSKKMPRLKASKDDFEQCVGPAIQFKVTYRNIERESSNLAEAYNGFH